MPENKNVIYMDQKGVDRLKKEIDELREKLAKVRKYTGSNPTDRYDAELEDMVTQIAILTHELNSRLSQLTRVKIIERKNSEEIVNVDDIVCIDMIFSDTDIEQNVCKLVGGSANMTKEIPEVSINSPLGKALFGNMIGGIYPVEVPNNPYNILIKSKLTLEDDFVPPSR